MHGFSLVNQSMEECGIKHHTPGVHMRASAPSTSQNRKEWVAGIVRFLGTTDFIEGEWIGLELKDP